jgi:hypothetical protein
VRQIELRALEKIQQHIQNNARTHQAGLLVSPTPVTS